MTDAMPSVLVGCPTADFKKYCLDDFIKGLEQLNYPNMKIMIVDNSENEDYFKEMKEKFAKTGLEVELIRDKWTDKAMERVVASRNLIRQYAIDNKFDYFFSLEQDVIPQEPDTIQKLLRHNKDIVSVLYVNNQIINKKPQLVPLAYVAHPEKPGLLTFAPVNELRQGKLLEVLAIGLGGVLIKRDVIEKVTFRTDGESFDDMKFSYDAIQAGYKIYCDTSVMPKHVCRSWENIKK